MINIAITGATITPNPVQTGKQYIISVEITDLIFALADNDGVGIRDGVDNQLILLPEQNIQCLEDGDGQTIIDDDGSILEHIQEG